jgi:putative ABC transport system substrate-binding protein
VLGAGLVSLASICFHPLARAQRRLWRIGYHSSASAQSNPGWLDAFRKGMAELGWSEAQHYVIDARYADGVPEAVPRLAAELVATQPDVLLTTAGISIKVLAQATSTIPIVFTIAADPVAEGFASNLQRPGRNLSNHLDTRPRGEASAAPQGRVSGGFPCGAAFSRRRFE